MQKPGFSLTPNRLVHFAANGIEGRDWHKEVGTARDEFSEAKEEGFKSNQERREFYIKRAENKLGDLREEVFQGEDGSGNAEKMAAQEFKRHGLSTIEDLQSKNLAERTIKSGDTLYQILEDYYGQFQSGEKVRQEVDTTLPWIQGKSIEGDKTFNVDRLLIGAKLKIEDGYLSITDPGGDAYAVRVPLKPGLGEATVDSTDDDAAEKTEEAVAETEWEQRGTEWINDRVKGRESLRQTADLVLKAVDQAKEALGDIDWTTTSPEEMQKIAELTNPWKTWNKFGVFKGDENKELRVQLQRCQVHEAPHQESHEHHHSFSQLSPCDLLVYRRNRRATSQW
jgi:hypothetical protein